MGEAVRLTAHGWVIRPARARTGRRSARVTGFRQFTSKAAGVSGAMWRMRRCTSAIAAVTIRSVFIVAWHPARAARARRTDLRRCGQPRDGPDCRWPRRCALEDVRGAVAASQRAGRELLPARRCDGRGPADGTFRCRSRRRPADVARAPARCSCKAARRHRDGAVRGARAAAAADVPPGSLLHWKPAQLFRTETSSRAQLPVMPLRRGPCPVEGRPVRLAHRPRLSADDVHDRLVEKRQAFV